MDLPAIAMVLVRRMQALRQAQPQHAEALQRVGRQVAGIEELVKRFPLTNPKVGSVACTTRWTHGALVA